MPTQMALGNPAIPPRNVRTRIARYWALFNAFGIFILLLIYQVTSVPESRFSAPEVVLTFLICGGFGFLQAVVSCWLLWRLPTQRKAALIPAAIAIGLITGAGGIVGGVFTSLNVWGYYLSLRGAFGFWPYFFSAFIFGIMAGLQRSRSPLET